MDSKHRNQRRYYRLAYPLSDRPRLLWGDNSFEVSEISEQGLRLYWPAADKPRQGRQLAGVITFYDGEQVEVTGVVGRSSDIEVVLVRLEGISFSRMVLEQRQLILKYAKYLAPSRP